VNPYTQAITAWKRPVEPDTPCAHCHHPRKHHCTKGKISIEVDGVPWGCSHYVRWLDADMRGEPRCDNTHCADVLDEAKRIFCTCPRFISPYSRKKRGKNMPLFQDEELTEMHTRYLQKQPPPAKTRTEILLECVAEFPDVTLDELADGAERSKSWVRKVLRANGITLPTHLGKAGKP
jgi:hypothetical protein